MNGPSGNESDQLSLLFPIAALQHVDLRPLYAGWVWLVGDELSEGNGRAGTVFLLVEPDCLWPSSTAAG